MLNRAILMGRLVADPELRQTPNGISVCSFTIAIDRNYAKDRERQADFIDIVAWRQSAEFVSRYFAKGKMIIVEGSIQTRLYEDKNGNKRKAVEVGADNVQFGESKMPVRAHRRIIVPLRQHRLPLSPLFPIRAVMWATLPRCLLIRTICRSN